MCADIFRTVYQVFFGQYVQNLMFLIDHHAVFVFSMFKSVHPHEIQGMYFWCYFRIVYQDFFGLREHELRLVLCGNLYRTMCHALFVLHSV